MTQPVIWYLHHYAGAPSLGMSYRPYYLCQEFNRQGYQSWIIGASFHHLLNTPMHQSEPVLHQKVDDQNFIFLKTPSYQGNTHKRFINMLSYAWRLWRQHKQLVAITGIPSVIIVSSAHPFHYYFARRIANKYHARLIFEVRDLWPLSLIELMNVSPANLLTRLLGHIEKSAYRTADFVVSLLPYAFDYMRTKGLDKRRFVHISNGVSIKDVAEQHILNKDASQLVDIQKQKGKFLIAYAGAHGVPNSLDDLLAALVLLKNEGYDRVHFFLIGDGCEKRTLQQLAEQHKLSSVTFMDKLPKNQVAPFLQLMDAVYLGWKKKQLYQYGVSPNKLFDYMLAAKPILQAFSSPNDLIKQIGCGVTVEAENPAAIADGIKQMAATTPDELLSMGNKGRNAVLSEFTYPQLAQKYTGLFDSAVQY